MSSTLNIQWDLKNIIQMVENSLIVERLPDCNYNGGKNNRPFNLFWTIFNHLNTTGLVILISHVYQNTAYLLSMRVFEHLCVGWLVVHGGFKDDGW